MPILSIESGRLTKLPAEMEIVHNDKLLAVRIAEGDESAFKQLFELYTPRLKAFFTKLVRDKSQVPELVQETFLNIWVYRSSMKSVDNPSAYIYRIASNVSVAWFRKADLEKQLLKNIAHSADPLPEQEVVSVKDLQRHIDKAVAKLPQQQQTVFRLSREQGLTRVQIAKEMNLSEKTVRNHLTMALAAIQKYLKDNYSAYIPLFLLQILLMR